MSRSDLEVVFSLHRCYEFLEPTHICKMVIQQIFRKCQPHHILFHIGSIEVHIVSNFGKGSITITSMTHEEQCLLTHNIDKENICVHNILHGVTTRTVKIYKGAPIRAFLITKLCILLRQVFCLKDFLFLYEIKKILPICFHIIPHTRTLSIKRPCIR